MKNYERRFVVEYLELYARIKNLEEYIERRRAGKDEGVCGLDLLELQLKIMRQYQTILETRADIEGLDLQEARL